MAASWCKVASNLDSHPKIRKAGRAGREVFLFALRRNAEPSNPVPGQLPKDELAPEYLADQLQMSVTEAVTGVTAAVTAGLLSETDHCYQITSWKDGWGKGGGSNAERQARYRENKKNKSNIVTRNVTRNASNDNKRNDDARYTDKKRRDKTISTSQVDADLTERLMGWIVKNNPTHKIASATPTQRSALVASWAGHVRLMREVDKRDPSEIGRVIDWCQSDPFWRTNILSTNKLREQWDQLVLRMQSKGQPAKVIKQPEPDDDTPPLFLLPGMKAGK